MSHHATLRRRRASQGPSVSERPGLDEALPNFLRAHLESIEQLVCLLLLHADGLDWAAAAAAARTGMTESLCEEALDALARGGLVARTPAGYRVALSAEQAEVVARVAEWYARAPIEVLRTMSSQAIERVRGGALRAFADAFVITKKRK